MNKTHHDNTKPPTSPPRGLERFPLSDAEEAQILQDVRNHVWQRYSQNLAPQARTERTRPYDKPHDEPRSTFAPWRLWPLAPVAALAAGMLLWWQPSKPPTEPLSLQGQARIGDRPSAQHTKTSLTQRSLALITQQKPATLQAAKRWHITIAAQSALAIEQIHPQHHRLQLRNGAITVDVTPQQIQLFEIALPHHHIHVKGTRFTVERTPRGWRVEMETGRIALVPATTNSPTTSQPSATPRTPAPIFLQHGQGARVAQSTGKIEIYPLPPTSHRAPSKRVAWWLSQNAPHIALRWLADRLERYPNEKVFYARNLQEIAEYYRAQKDIPRVLSLLVDIHKRNIPNESELALPEALALCRTVATHPACMQVFQLSLQQKNPGPFAEHALFWLAVGLHQQGASSQKESNKLLWRYIQQFPNGEHIPRVLALLQKTTPSPQICASIAKRLPKHNQRPTWWNRVCAPR